MELCNYRKVTEYWLRRSHTLSIQNIASRFIDTLRLSGVREGKVKDYAQLSLKIPN